MIKKYSFTVIFMVVELILALVSQHNFIKNNAILLSLITSLFLIIVPFLFFLLAYKNQEKYTFVFIFYSIFKVIPYVFSMKGNFFEVIFQWKFYLDILFSFILIWNFILFLKRFRDNYKKHWNEENDDLTTISIAIQNVFVFKKLGKILAFEVSSFYYCFLKWKQPSINANLFSGYKNSGIIALFVSLIFLSIVEAGAFHIFLFSEHKNIALIFAFIHIYVLINLIGHLKAIVIRKHFISSNKILIRYGLFDTLEIPVKLIVKITKFDGNYEKSENVVKFALLAKLEPHNILVELKDNMLVYFPFGIVKNPNKILLYLDEPSKILGLV